MGFFDDIDSSGIVEQHLKQVLKLEDSQSKSLLERYKNVRQELRDRLSRTRADTFTAQQIRGVLAQVEAAIEAMNSQLKDGMTDGAKEAALQGVEHLIDEMESFQSEFQDAVVPINLNAQLVALDTQNFLLSQYESSIDAYGTDLIKQITGNLSQAALMEMPYGSVITKLDQFFIGEQWKLERIARTELHHVYSLGKMNGMSEIQDNSIPDLKKTLFHPMDARTADDSKYANRLHLVAEIDEPFRYRWKGKRREFMVPPDRPNDRSILIPYREEWGTL